MDASRSDFRPLDVPFAPVRGCLRSSTAALRWAGRAAGVALAVTFALAGCGTKVNAPLPESNVRTQPPAGDIKTKTPAEQKKAIDDLIAKRDAAK